MAEKTESKELVRMGNEKRSRQILETACRLFANKGYDAVTTKEIAKATNCSEALIFRYFPTKEIIYQVLFDEWKAGEIKAGSSFEVAQTFWTLIASEWYISRNFAGVHPKLSFEYIKGILF